MSKNKKSIPANSGDASSEEVGINFIVKKFNYNGIEYNAGVLEAAAAVGDVSALKVIQELVDIKSGVIEIVK